MSKTASVCHAWLECVRMMWSNCWLRMCSDGLFKNANDFQAIADEEVEVRYDVSGVTLVMLYIFASFFLTSSYETTRPSMRGMMLNCLNAGN